LSLRGRQLLHQLDTNLTLADTMRLYKRHTDTSYRVRSCLIHATGNISIYNLMLVFLSLNTLFQGRYVHIVATHNISQYLLLLKKCYDASIAF